MTLDRRNLPEVREGELAASATIPHLDIPAARTAPQTGERNALLIATMFDGCLWVSCGDARNRGMIAVVLATGLRLGEIADLGNYDLFGDHLRVAEKTGERQAAITVCVRTWIG